MSLFSFSPLLFFFLDWKVQTDLVWILSVFWGETWPSLEKAKNLSHSVVHICPDPRILMKSLSELSVRF